MGTKLSISTRGRRWSLRALTITAMLVAGLAITASGASAAKRYGVWTVRPGWTLDVGMVMHAHDLDTAYIYVDGMRYDTLGGNAGHQDGSDPNLPDYFYTPPDRNKHTVTLDLNDATNPCDSFSFGPNAAENFARFDLFAINDGSLGCGTTPIGVGETEFYGNVTITHTP
jgi:hypothetical protein